MNLPILYNYKLFISYYLNKYWSQSRCNNFCNRFVSHIATLAFVRHIMPLGFVRKIKCWRMFKILGHDIVMLNFLRYITTSGYDHDIVVLGCVHHFYFKMSVMFTSLQHWAMFITMRRTYFYVIVHRCVLYIITL